MSEAMNDFFHDTMSEQLCRERELVALYKEAVTRLVGTEAAKPFEVKPVPKSMCCSEVGRAIEYHQALVNDMRKIIAGKLDEEKKVNNVMADVLEDLIGGAICCADTSLVDTISHSDCKTALTLAMELLKSNDLLLYFANICETENQLDLGFTNSKIERLFAIATDFAASLDAGKSELHARSPHSCKKSPLASDQMSALKAEVAAYRKLLQDAADEYSPKLEALEAQVKEANEKAHNMQNALATATDAIRKLSDSIDGPSSAKAPKSAKKGQASDDVSSTLKRAIATLAKKLEGRQQPIVHQNQPDLANATDAGSDLKRENTRLTSKVAALEQQLSTMRDNYDSVLKDLENAKERLESLTNTLKNIGATKASGKPKKRNK